MRSEPAGRRTHTDTSGVGYFSEYGEFVRSSRPRAGRRAAGLKRSSRYYNIRIKHSVAFNDGQNPSRSRTRTAAGGGVDPVPGRGRLTAGTTSCPCT